MFHRLQPRESINGRSNDSRQLLGTLASLFASRRNHSGHHSHPTTTNQGRIPTTDLSSQLHGLISSCLRPASRERLKARLMPIKRTWAKEPGTVRPGKGTRNSKTRRKFFVIFQSPCSLFTSISVSVCEASEVAPRSLKKL